MKKISILLAVMSLFILNALAHAETIELIGSESWWDIKVESVRVGSVPNWYTYNQAKWESLQSEFTFAQGAFGNSPNSANPSKVHTNWSGNSALYLQKVISSPNDYIVESLLLNVSVDNGFVMFINGLFVAARYAEGYVPAKGWEYSLAIPTDLWNQGGENLIQVIALDWGNPTFFDMELKAGVLPTPLPAGVVLLGTGLAGMVFVRRHI